MAKCTQCGCILQANFIDCPKCGQKTRNGLSTPALSLHMHSGLYTHAQSPYYQNAPAQPRTIPFSQMPQTPKNKPPRLLIGTVIVLSLLLIASGAALLYHTTVARPAELRAQATATVVADNTARAQATATVDTQSTSTATVQKNGSATAIAQATVRAKATASALQDIYTRNTKGTPTLSNSLTDQSDAGWDTYPTQDGGGCTFTDGVYHASVNDQNHYTPCFAHNTKFSNFALEVTMTILQGDEGGIIFRSHNDNRNFYSLRIKTDSTYTLMRTKDDSKITSLVYNKSSAVKKGIGKANVVTIIAQGSNIHLYINKQFAGSISDNSYSSGSIGLIAIARQNATDIAFHNLRVWKR